MHRLAVIGSSLEFIRLVRLAKEKGYETIVCDGYPDGVAKQYADKAYTIDIRRPEEVAAMLVKEKADGITGSFSDLIFEKVTEIAALAGLPWYAKPEQIPFYREKDITKRILAECGVAVPKNRRIPVDFQEEEIAGFRFPLVVKPVDGYGSKGIIVVHSLEELRKRIGDVNRLGTGSKAEVIVEEYSRGKEYNFMTWLHEGIVYPLSLADREKNPFTGDTVPSSNRNVYPARRCREILPEALEVLKKFAAYTGQQEGPLSMQFFYNENGIEVCEVAGRMFGYEHELVTLAGGADIEELMLAGVYEPDEVKRILVENNPCFTKHCCVVYFFARQGTRVTDQSVLKQVLEAHCLQTDLFYKEGDIVDNYGPKPYFARGYLRADTREELDEITDRIFSEVSVRGESGEEILIRPVREEK